MSYQQEIAGGYFWRTLWIQQNGVLAVVDRRMRHWVANAGYYSWTTKPRENREFIIYYKIVHVVQNNEN